VTLENAVLVQFSDKLEKKVKGGEKMPELPEGDGE
jgi:hypothetical protein